MGPLLPIVCIPFSYHVVVWAIGDDKQVARKVGRKPEELVMITSADFRERSETYDVLQMAIPAKEKQVRRDYKHH